MKRRALFGDLHVHTSASFDAYTLLQNREIGPDEALRFATGEPIVLFGLALQRSWPLDFIAITDHPENLGVASTVGDASSPFAKTELGQEYARSRDPRSALAVTLEAYRRDIDPVTSAAAWRANIDAANRYYRPGRFTTFIGFEWASQESDSADRIGRAIHRNVIFAGDDAPFPFTILNSRKLEDLWTYMETVRENGSDVIAITNHPTASHGLAFDEADSDGRPLDRIYAIRRMLNEPLSEISGGGNDFESNRLMSPGDTIPFRSHSDGNAGVGALVRDAWGRGLVLGARIGANPFAFGVVGTSDSHTGLSMGDRHSFRQADSRGAAPAEGGGVAATWPDVFAQLPGSLTGVWAEENRRKSIFAAFRRKEVFATSGPRMQARIFGGWRLDGGACERKDWVSLGYSKGVPMGGRLALHSTPSSRPQFILWATKAPEGNGLERLQMIKIVLDGGRYVEHIHEVVRSTAPSGSEQLCASWTDPDFDAVSPAIYYLRGLAVADEHGDRVLGAVGPSTEQPHQYQHRVWTSPIWYQPTNVRLIPQMWAREQAGRLQRH